MPSSMVAASPAYRRGQLAAGVAASLAALGVIWIGVRVSGTLLDPLVTAIAPNALLNASAKAFVIVNFIALHVLFLIWWERKFAGWMQARLGPMHVGWKGLGQTLADAVKLLIKEDIVPTKADRALFFVGPFIVFVPTVMTFMVLPFSSTWLGLDYPLAMLFVIAISTNAAVGILAAGFGANNKYSLLGGARAVAQVLSYEIPMVLVVLTVVMLTGTMSLAQAGAEQTGLWNIVRYPILIPAFLIFLISGLAELNRTPFDLPEADSELVSGFNTEYSGMRFAFFFLAEFANNFFTAGFAVILFFGAWHGPILPEPVWFTLKTLVVVTLLMWIRWTVPRLRVDQMMGFCWKLLVPAALVVFCIAAWFSVS